MNKFSKVFTAFLVIMLPILAEAAQVVVTGPNSKIRQIIRVSFASPDAAFRGDTAFGVSSLVDPTVCAGAFIAQSDRMYSEIVSTVQLAIAANITVAIYADSAQVWGGSPTKFCRITGIELLQP